MRLRGKLIAFVFVATFLPLAVYGVISVREARSAARVATLRGNALSATQAATRISQYLRNHRDILKALAETVSPNARLNDDQINRVLRNYVLEFRGFRALTLVDREGRRTATTRLSGKAAGDEERGLVAAALAGQPARGTLRVGEEGPEIDLAVPLRAMGEVVGALVGTVDLIELWHMVDSIKIGDTGYAMVVERGGRVLAAGPATLKARVLAGEPIQPAGPLSEALGETSAPRTHVGEYTSAEGAPVIGAAARIPELDWAIVVEQPAGEAYASAESLERRLWILAAAALLLALLAAVVIGTRFLAVIRDLVRGTEKISRGDFQARVEPRSRDELGDLGRDFNHMAERLDALTREVRRKERMAAFGRIAAGLAHDLKAPFTSIKHQLRLLGMAEDDPEIREKAKKRIDEQVQHVEQFISALHGLMQERETVRVDLDLLAVFPRVLDGFTAQAATDGTSLTFDAPPDLPRVRGAAFELARVLENLVKNALEAVQGRAGAKVAVTARQDEGTVLISIADNGPGIAAERLPLLFEEFRTTKRSGMGLGLGLPTAQKLVEAQGGTLEVKSAAGAGATFLVRLPAVQERARLTSADPAPISA